VAKSWDLPGSLQRYIRLPSAAPLNRPADPQAERPAWLAQAANAAAHVMLKSDLKSVDKELQQIIKRYAKSLDLPARDFQSALIRAKENLSQIAQAMNLHVPKDRPALDANRGGSKVLDDDGLHQHQLDTIVQSQASDYSAPYTPEQATQVLASGIQDITNSMVDTYKLNDVLQMILETMLRGLQFNRVVFCLRDPKTDTLTGRFGLGANTPEICSRFKIPLQSSTDLFSLVCQKGVDTLINDTASGNIGNRLPAWYKESAHSPAFLLLPMHLKKTCFGLIYADMPTANALQLGEKELSMLRTLRNQAILAFKQSS
jgi:eukaryotic-like serine/threonine-protein kinase